jgi:glycosyltransferase involved in cell wall biosynthesis
VTSNVSSLPEVAGDAALLVDPASPGAIAAALERILVDQGMAARLRADGPARARQFTARAWAAATMDVYREAVGDRR